MSLLPYFDDFDMLKNQFLSSTTWLSSTNHQNLDLDLNSVFKLDKGLFTADFDLCHYKPEEITVKAQGNFIEIEGKHSESTGNQQSSRHFMRKFTVPQSSDVNNIITKMSSNGILTLSMSKIRKESKEVPIVRLGVLDTPWMRQEQSHNSRTKSEEFTQTQQSTTRSDKFQQSQTTQSKLQEEISSKRVEERQIPVVQESNKQIQSTENKFREKTSEYKNVPIVQSSSKHEEVSIRQEQSTVQNKAPVVQKVFEQEHVEIVQNKNATNTVQERQVPVKMESHLIEERREESKINQKQVVPIVQTNFGNEQVKVVQSESKQTTEYIKERQIPVVQESSTLIKEKQEESEVRKQVLSRAPVVQTSFEEVQVIQKNFNSNNVQQQSFEKSSNFEQNSSKINQNKERQIPIVQEGTLQSTLIKETQEIQNKNLNNSNIKQTVCQENTQKTSSTVKSEEIQIPLVQEGSTVVKERQIESTIHKEIRPVVETSFEEIQVVQKSNFGSGNLKQTLVEENVEKSRNVQQNTSVIQTNESLIPITQEGKLNSTLVKEKQVETVVQKEIPNIKDVQFVQSDDFQKSFEQNVAIIKERNLENTTVKEKQIPIVQQNKKDSTITEKDTVIQRDVPVMPKSFEEIEVVQNKNVNKSNVENHSTLVKQSVNKSDSFEENVSVVQKLGNQSVINDKQNPVVKERVETSVVETREESVFQDNIPLSRRNVEEVQTAVSNKSNVEHQHHTSRVQENYEKSNISKKSVEDIQTVQNVSQQHHSNIKQKSIEKSENVNENQINIREKQSPIVQEHATVITERRQVQSKIQNNVPVLQNTFEEQEIAVIQDGKVTKHHQSSVVQENLAQNKEIAIQDSTSIRRNSDIEQKNVVQQGSNNSNRFEQKISNNSSIIERQEETKISKAPKVQTSYEIEETTSVVESNNSKGVQETQHRYEQVRRNSKNKFEQEFSSVTQKQIPTVQQGTSKIQNTSEQHETSLQNKLELISKPLTQNKEHSSTVIKESRQESNVEYKQINDMPVVQTTSVQEEEIQIVQKGGFGVQQRSEESTTRKNFRKESIESVGGVQIEELDNCSVYSADLNRPIVESPMDQRFNPMSP